MSRSCCGAVHSQEFLTIQRKRRASAEQLAYQLLADADEMQQSAQNVQPRRSKAPAQRKRSSAESDVRSTCVSSERIRVVPEGQRRVPGGIVCAGRTHNFDTVSGPKICAGLGRFHALRVPLCEILRVLSVLCHRLKCKNDRVHHHNSRENKRDYNKL